MNTQHTCIQAHDIKKGFIYVLAKDRDTAVFKTVDFLTDWIANKIPYEELPEYGNYLFSMAYPTLDYQASFVIDKICKVYYLDGQSLEVDESRFDATWQIDYRIRPKINTSHIRS